MGSMKISDDIDDLDEHQMNSDLINNLNQSNSSLLNRTQNHRVKTQRRITSTRLPCGYLIFASESRKRLIRDNPGIPFGDMSRIIGDQVREILPLLSFLI